VAELLSARQRCTEQLVVQRGSCVALAWLTADQPFNSRRSSRQLTFAARNRNPGAAVLKVADPGRILYTLPVGTRSMRCPYSSASRSRCRSVPPTNRGISSADTQAQSK